MNESSKIGLSSYILRVEEYQHRYHTEKELYAASEEFAYSPFETCSVLLPHIKIISQSEERQINHNLFEH
jgi:hypothetical protein